MVKGISKQVIVVQAPEEKLFEQAIFILSEKAVGGEGITDDALLREARKLMGMKTVKHKPITAYGAVWALTGALAMGAAWLISILL